MTSNLLLPVGGLSIAIVAGWALPPRLLVEELHLSQTGATAPRLTLRYLAPIGIVIAARAPFVFCCRPGPVAGPG